MSKIPINKVADFEDNFLSIMRTKGAKTLEQLKAGKINDELKESLRKFGNEVAKSFEVA